MARPFTPTLTLCAVMMVLSAAFPQLDEAIEAIRIVVAEDPALSTNLKARGFGPDDVVGLTHGPSGEVTLFVSNQT